jgi:hypothetical protein
MTSLRMISALKFAAAALTVLGAAAKLGQGKHGALRVKRLLRQRAQRVTGLSKEQVDLYAGVEKHDGFSASDAHKAFAHLRHKEVA